MEINRKLPLAFDAVIAERIIEAENKINLNLNKKSRNHENLNFSFRLKRN